MGLPGFLGRAPLPRVVARKHPEGGTFVHYTCKVVKALIMGSLLIKKGKKYVFMCHIPILLSFQQLRAADLGLSHLT